MISALDGCDGWNGGDHTQNNPGLPLFKKKKKIKSPHIGSGNSGAYL